MINKTTYRFVVGGRDRSPTVVQIILVRWAGVLILYRPQLRPSLFGKADIGEITMLEAVMRTTMMYAIQGKSWAVQFLADRLEGKPRQTIELEQHEPIQLLKTGIDNFDNG